MKCLKFLICILLFITIQSCTSNDSLPAPSISDGVRGELGIDKNINEDTIDNYLNRDDAVYRDVRLLVDSANYEEVGGSSITEGIIEGFEIVSYPYLCNATDLPEEVGYTYNGNTLFTKTSDGYRENYDESLAMLEEFFPKNKIIFIMCGGGGYAGQTKELLVYYGWDANKVYNVGGYWYYKGDHSIDIKKEEGGKVIYDMSDIIYHNIDFNTLNAKSDYIVNNEVTNTISFKEINNKVLETEDTILLFTYLQGCSACTAFKQIINDLKLYNDLDIYQIEFNQLNTINIELDELKYAPSLIIIKDGEVLDYLDSSKEEDKEYYKKASSLSEWLSNYIDINKVSTNNINDEDCNNITCEIK